ncbi:MAG: T9SS type A sorting domain-containing protein [Ignavibacteria bacterium]|nr:T9SS type A sorting domain-containing protein [Ignavibacteria bacterium]
MLRRLSLLLLWCVISVVIYAQTPAVDVPLTVTDGAANGTQVLHLGLDPAATDGIDASLGELVLPPLPPTGVFDARFNLPVTPVDASLKDFRQGTASQTVTKNYEVQYQVGTGTTITLSWNLPANITGTLQDLITGTIVNVPMSGSGNYVVTNPNNLNKLKVVMNFTPGATAPAAPALSSPANNATNQATALTLNWAASSGATTYRIQVSTVSTFATTLVNDSTVTTTSKQISGLANNTKYYWRVNAKNATGTSSWSDVWNFTTATAQTGLVYDLPLVITDGAGGTATLKFGLAPDATDGIDSQYGEMPLPPLPPTGVFDARFNLPVTPADASLKDYRQGTSTTTVTKSYEIQYQVGTGTTINIAWNLPSNVTGVLQDLITGTVVNVAMSGVGNYTVTNPGNLNKLKATMTFTAGGGTAPDAPVLSTPANNATGQTTSLALNWNASAGATSYRVQVSTASDFSTTIVNDSTLTGTSKQVTGLANNTKYYWRVNAKNSYGTSTWSSVWNFTTAAAQTVPDAPVLSTPANNATNQSTSLTLNWNASTGAATYRVQLSTASDFSTTLVNDSTLTGTSKQISGLANNTKYYWRVNAKNAAGTSTWSSVWNFTTAPAQTGLVYDLPLVVTDGSGGTATLKFGLAPDATDGLDSQYGELPLPPLPPTGVFDARLNLPVSPVESSLKDYRQGNASTATTKVYEVQYQVGNGTTINIAWNLPANVTGTLQDLITGTVVNVPMSGSGNYTVTNPGNLNKLKFTINYATGGTTPTAPVLATPANNAVNQSLTVPLTWNASTGATGYRVQVSTATDFATTIVDDPNVTVTNKTVSGLAYNTKYYWRVNAKNNNGSGDWSTVWNFTTMSAPSVAINVPITVTDSAGGTLNLALGLSPQATDGIDTVLGEYPLPPVPPTSVFDARFNLPVGNDASWKDYRKGYDTSITTTVHELQYQTGAGNKITVSWNMPQRTVGLMQDVVTGTLLVVPMKGAGSYTIANPASISKVKITVRYVVPIAPDRAVLVSPDSAATGVSLTPTLKWKKANNALAYRVQVSKTLLFTTNVVDTITADTAKTIGGLTNVTKYYWRVMSINDYTNAIYSTIFNFITKDVSVQETPGHASEFALDQNYPNPFNPSTRITYSLPVESKVKLEVYSMLGEKIATLFDGTKPAGSFTATFNARNLNSGVYLVRLDAKSATQNFVQVRKMILMK